VTTIRIATWNLDQFSNRSPRAKACREIMANVDADIWVLTEIHRNFIASDLYDKDGSLNRYECILESLETGEIRDGHWVSVWAKKSLHGKSESKIERTERTVCAMFDSIGEIPIWVYGTVLPWLGSSWKGIRNAGGAAFKAALDGQKNDWDTIINQGKGWLCVAGDFNQEFYPEKHYYGSKNQQSWLDQTLASAQLECLTGRDKDPVAEKFPGNASIDHICFGGSADTRWQAGIPQSWPRVIGPTFISDHHCVSVDIKIP
jgi:hypothetical protein